MNSQNPSRHKRRSPEQWQTLVDQYQGSGLSGAKFCLENNISYASFCNWRHKLINQPAVADATSANFIDLNVLSQTRRDEGQTAPWHIVLKLGNGVELCLSQPHAAA